MDQSEGDYLFFNNSESEPDFLFSDKSSSEQSVSFDSEAESNPLNSPVQTSSPVPHISSTSEFILTSPVSLIPPTSEFILTSPISLIPPTSEIVLTSPISPIPPIPPIPENLPTSPVPPVPPISSASIAPPTSPVSIEIPKIQNHSVLNSVQFPSLLWPNLHNSGSYKALDIGNSENFFFASSNNSDIPNPNLGSPKKTNSRGPNLKWIPQNQDSKDGDYWRPKTSLRFARPPINKHELPNTSYSLPSVNQMIKQFQEFEPATEVPPIVLESFLKESLYQNYLVDNFDPLFGNRACLFIPEMAQESIDRMSWIFYLGGPINNEPKFVFSRSQSEVSMIETLCDLDFAKENPESIPIKYQPIGEPYIFAERNRFINHIAPSMFNPTEILLSSLDYSARLWDFSNETSNWMVCEYWNSPRTFVSATRNQVSAIDSRVSLNTNPKALINFDSVQDQIVHEKITSIKVNPLDSMHLAVGTNQKIHVYDLRYPNSPLISWAHNFSTLDPPFYLEYTTQYPTQSLDKSRKACSVIAASKRHSLISAFSYTTDFQTETSIVSKSRDFIPSFHSHESTKYLLLDSMASTQFGFEESLHLMSKNEIAPLPYLDGFVLAPNLPDSSKERKNQKSNLPVGYDIFQVSSNGSVYCQEFDMIKPSSSCDVDADSLSQTQDCNSSEPHYNTSDIQNKDSTPIDTPSLDNLKDICVHRNASLDLIDGNQQTFITFDENYRFKENEKISFSMSEWPFSRVNVKTALFYFYNNITRKRQWFSSNELFNFNIFKTYFEKNSREIYKIVDSAILIGLKSETFSRIRKKDQSVKSYILNLKKIALSKSSQIKAASEVLSSAIQVVVNFYKMDVNGKLLLKNNISERPANMVLLSYNILTSPLLLRIQSIIENRIFELLLYFAFKKNEDYAQRIPRFHPFSKELESLANNYSVYSLELPSVGKIGIDSKSKFYQELFKMEKFPDLKEVISMLSDKSHQLLPIPSNSGFWSSRSDQSKYMKHALCWITKNLVFSLTTLKFTDEKISISRDSREQESHFHQSDIYFKEVLVSNPPRFNRVMKSLDKLWESSSLQLNPASRNQYPVSLLDPNNHTRSDGNKLDNSSLVRSFGSTLLKSKDRDYNESQLQASQKASQQTSAPFKIPEVSQKQKVRFSQTQNQNQSAQVGKKSSKHPKKKRRKGF
ncbi:hypothetical protein BB560_004335 [Smittium megazygosporum]|uniref:Uncharacterized protein n=1 Tax=Smittium megazygosporum TaxID=133381 RepID=A0A2T9Z466_9FUNG|nr:hypothetical protein BB560_005520 [Smittium megazygosporum]PVV01255.1 hypothetical protein BB560_004335 [Smittium megazygosporum]